MDNTIMVFSGRAFSPKDIELIKWMRNTYPKLSIQELAATVCELLEWTTPAGRPKVGQCRAFLNKLESEDIIKLPTKRNQEIVEELYNQGQPTVFFKGDESFNTDK